jgi:fucose permease
MAIAFLIPLTCFAFIAFYALYGQNLKSKTPAIPLMAPKLSYEKTV